MAAVANRIHTVTAARVSAIAEAHAALAHLAHCIATVAAHTELWVFGEPLKFVNRYLNAQISELPSTSLARIDLMVTHAAKRADLDVSLADHLQAVSDAHRHLELAELTAKAYSSQPTDALELAARLRLGTAGGSQLLKTVLTHELIFLDHTAAGHIAKLANVPEALIRKLSTLLVQEAIDTARAASH